MMKNFHLFLRWGIFAVQNNIKTICMVNNSLTALWIEKFTSWKTQIWNNAMCTVLSFFFQQFLTVFDSKYSTLWKRQNKNLSPSTIQTSFQTKHSLILSFVVNFSVCFVWLFWTVGLIFVYPQTQPAGNICFNTNFANLSSSFPVLLKNWSGKKIGQTNIHTSHFSHISASHGLCFNFILLLLTVLSLFYSMDSKQY